MNQLDKILEVGEALEGRCGRNTIAICDDNVG